MVVLDSCPKHNMIAYLEKSEGNAEFQEIIDFLTRSSIRHALTYLLSTELRGQGQTNPLLSFLRPYLLSSIIPDSYSRSSGGNLGTVSDQAKEIQHLKDQIKKLKKQAKPVIKLKIRRIKSNYNRISEMHRLKLDASL
ncbi:hypothetical protein Tco_1275556 [Tanacetum coccineum]